MLILRTNADGAEDFKIVGRRSRTPGRANWRDLVPHRRGVYLLDVTVLARLAGAARARGRPAAHRRAAPRRAARSTRSRSTRRPIRSASDGGYEFDTDRLRFTYSSMTTPAEVWDYDLETRARTLRKRQEVPCGHDPAAYVTRRLLAPTADGETVPISLLHRKDTPLDGTRALPALRLRRLRQRDAGLVRAPAGSRWSIAASSMPSRMSAAAPTRAGAGTATASSRKKPNTFTDFIAAAEYLRRRRAMRRAGRIVAHGGSAGGMLMGAIANLRPDLFAGIIAEVPFVDVLNTMLDDTLPLTPPEWPEWGNPIADAQAFRTILGYSPYDNVRAQAYPAILALAGLTDPRVTYWEPAKWVARAARAAAPATNLIALTHQHGRRPRRRVRPLRPAEGSRAAPTPSRSRSRARQARSPRCPARQIVLQIVDGAKRIVPCGSCGFDRTVGVERVGHAVDHAGLEHGRARCRHRRRGRRRPLGRLRGDGFRWWRRRSGRRNGRGSRRR